ncbi:MAG: hypothetical protein M3280_04735 [Actinomycetota bacterium]|nr:hypothetical protein [Actinomycetota bacterium]
MGIGDSIRNFFSKKKNPDLSALEAFARDRKGVEGFIEPRTATHPTTLLLVDRSGSNIRGEVRDPEDAVAFCEALGIPVYDAAVVGYPQRMRDFERGRSAAAGDELDRQIADLERRLDDAGPTTPDN